MPTREQQLEQALRRVLELFGDFEPTPGDSRQTWKPATMRTLRSAQATLENRND